MTYISLRKCNYWTHSVLFRTFLSYLLYVGFHLYFLLIHSFLFSCLLLSKVRRNTNKKTINYIIKINILKYKPFAMIIWYGDTVRT